MFRLMLIMTLHLSLPVFLDWTTKSCKQGVDKCDKKYLLMTEPSDSFWDYWYFMIGIIMYICNNGGDIIFLSAITCMASDARSKWGASINIDRWQFNL